mmetsp:Transcript_32777/g.76557  ORF Transcript_32777/g.76557 Transcript_32777/m.76557 type:complete len:233 (-) Transcript_32777:2920-3618(-)
MLLLEVSQPPVVLLLLLLLHIDVAHLSPVIEGQGGGGRLDRRQLLLHAVDTRTTIAFRCNGRPSLAPDPCSARGHGDKVCDCRAQLHAPILSRVQLLKLVRCLRDELEHHDRELRCPDLCSILQPQHPVLDNLLLLLLLLFLGNCFLVFERKGPRLEQLLELVVRDETRGVAVTLSHRRDFRLDVPEVVHQNLQEPGHQGLRVRRTLFDGGKGVDENGEEDVEERNGRKEEE